LVESRNGSTPFCPVLIVPELESSMRLDRYPRMDALVGEKRTTAHVILTLGQDLETCHENLIQSFSDGVVEDGGAIVADYEFHARQLIRAVFAYIEAVTFSVKLSAASKCMRDNVEISPPERYFAIEIAYDINDNGEVTERKAHIRLISNIRFALSIYERAFGLTSEFDPKLEWWTCLKESIKVRDRLTHPKFPRDVDVSGDEIVKALKAKDGFSELLYRYLELSGELPSEEALKAERGGRPERVKPKYLSKSGRPWTDGDVERLRALAKIKAPAHIIGLKLKRTERAVRTKATYACIKLTLKEDSRGQPKKRQKK
jgi:hypothetical protein